MHWGEYERVAWGRVLNGDLHTSAYCVRKGLTRKANFAYNMRKWTSKHPEGVLARSMPETFLFEFWDIEYFEEAVSDVPEVKYMKEGDVWILKPSMTNQTRGIVIFDSLDALREALEEEGAEDVREWVIQKYISRPLLVGGRKFHLRAYLLCVGALEVYVYKDVLTLFALTPYDASDLKNMPSHLTNTCRQAPKDAEEESKAVGLLEDLPARLAAEGAMTLDEATARVRGVEERMRAVLGECLEAVSSELSFIALENAFELFGMDLMIDEDWNVWLLEANAEPDFAQTGDRLRKVVEGVVEGTLQLSVDKWFAAATQAAGGSAGGGGRNEDSTQQRQQPPVDFVQVFSRRDPRAQKATISFK